MLQLLIPSRLRLRMSETNHAVLKRVLAGVEAIQAHLAGSHKQHYTVNEIATATGRAPFTIRRWITEGKLNAVRIDGTGPKGRLLVPHAELARLIQNGHGEHIPAELMQFSSSRRS